ncbi:MAG: FAD-binding protein [Candidatus Baltobacteraceae bacterium]
MERSAELCERLVAALGREAVKTAIEDLVAYSGEARQPGMQPVAVVLPSEAREVSAVVGIAHEFAAPIVARGAGTGLCGGAVPTRRGILLSFARMNRVLALDARNRRVRVQPGATVRALGAVVQECGLFFGPDPSSGAVATLGGSVATNAGGPRTNAYGAMAEHVLALEVVLDDGTIVELDRDDAGYDLLAALVGSEGTLGIVTALELRLLPLPASTRLALGAFADFERALSATLAADANALTSLQIVDVTILRALDAYGRLGVPEGTRALVVAETSGERDDAAANEAALVRLFGERDALWYRLVGDAERPAVRTFLDAAFGALGRVAPNSAILDLCVPRTAMPEAFLSIETAVRSAQVAFGMLVRAGEGVLQPVLTYNRRDRRASEAVASASEAITSACFALGGSVGAEHGFGSVHRSAFSDGCESATLDALRRVRDAFAPSRALNPGKILPEAAWP